MMKKLPVLFVIIGLCACAPARPAEPAPLTSQPASPSITAQAAPQSTEEVSMSFVLSSPAFENGEPIPPDHSCKGSNITPTLTWTTPPAGTVRFALIMNDPDAPAGTWVHWVLFNIPAAARGLPEGLPTDAQLADGSVQGITSARSHGYHGPCPPSGTHRYYFKLYALDITLPLGSDADKAQVLAAMEGHILAVAELMGIFSK